MNRTLVLVAAAVSLLALPAFAQPAACSSRDNVLKQLSSQFSEAPIGMGVVGNGGIIEFLSSKAGQTWTIILTMPNGVSCLIAAGESWERVPVKAKPDPKA
jgi:hypothetical protein